MKLKLLLVCLSLFLTTFLSAQTADKTIIANAGNSVVTAEASISFTIGEPVVGLVSNENSISQGFWVGSLQVEPITVENELDGILIFPNPVENQLNIFTNSNPIYAITLFAVDGRRILKKKVDVSLLEHHIDLSHLSKGMYVLRLLIEDSDEAKLFKIIKK